MSAVGMSVTSTEYDAAQALLDLQSNIRESKHEQYDREETVEAAKLLMSCFMTSNLAKQPINASPKVGTVSPMYEGVKSASSKSDIATTHSPKRQTPDQELTRAPHSHMYHSEEPRNRRSKIFKRKPNKYTTVTSGPVPSSVASKVPNSAKNDYMSKVSETKEKTRDVGTQTELKYQLPIIETIEFTISKLSEKIQSLEEQNKSNSQLMETIDVSDNDNDFDDDDDESYKVNSHEMTMDDNDDRKTPEKVKTKRKAGQFNEYNKTAKVLSDRNVNANNADDLVPIGDGNALIPSIIFRHVNWNSYSSATRKLLAAVFTRRILATHSLTGKSSPAFPNKPAKMKLDPALVNDIVQTVVERCCVPENLVRTCITTKCADESKMFRTRENNKMKRKLTVNREHIPPETDSDEF